MLVLEARSESHSLGLMLGVCRWMCAFARLGSCVCLCVCLMQRLTGGNLWHPIGLQESADTSEELFECCGGFFTLAPSHPLIFFSFKSCFCIVSLSLSSSSESPYSL